MTLDDDELRLRRDVLLTFQVALLGMVGPTLRGVTVGWSAADVTGLLLFDGEIGSDEQECASDIEAEVAASFTAHKVRVTAARCDSPERLNEHGLMAWVYSRRE